MEKHYIGFVSKPQALKGAMRVRIDPQFRVTFENLDKVFVEDREYAIAKIIDRKDFYILYLDTIVSCEQAEFLRNKQIFAEFLRDENSIYNTIGYDVFSGECLVGKVVDVQNFGATDILDISGDKNIMVPIAAEVIEKVDNDCKKIVLNQTIFEQVAVYED